VNLTLLGAATSGVIAIVDFVHGNYVTCAIFVALAGALVAVDNRRRNNGSDRRE